MKVTIYDVIGAWTNEVSDVSSIMVYDGYVELTKFEEEERLPRIVGKFKLDSELSFRFEEDGK